MGLMDAAVAIYLGGYMAILAIVCVIGYVKNYRGREESIEESDVS